MLRRAIPRGALSGAGLEGLGRLIVRHPVLVIVSWVLLAATMFLTLPPLMEVAERKPPGLLPDSSQVMIAGNEMGEAFKEGAGSGNSGNVGAIILANEDGLTEQDEKVYRRIVERLQQMPEAVLSTQDFVSIPELKQVMTSEDGKAWQLPISMQGTMGTGEGQRAYKAVLKEVQELSDGEDLEVNVIGPAATFDDLNKISKRDQTVVETVTVIAVLVILVMVYRNIVAIILPMLMIGLGLVVAQAAVAGLGSIGVIGLGPQTLMLMTAMMMGAGTDYAIFFFTRYHECVRSGETSDDAVVTALGSIGKVIAGSAGTTALAFVGLAFTELGAFSTVGPALAVTVLIGFLVAVTLLPAMIVITGRRGWVKPRKDLTGRWWRRSGIKIVRKPKSRLAVSLAILIGLAVCCSMVEFNYDERQSLPADASSNVGYAALDKHFPVSSTIQQFLLVQAPDQDLRSPKALADMEEMAKRVAGLPDIAMVRGITRPTGEVLEEAKATWQAGEVGSKLGEASQLIEDNDDNLNLLSGGAHQLADTLDQLRDGVLGAIVTLRPLMDALTDMSEKYGGGATLEEVDETATLVANMKGLGAAMGDSLVQMAEMYSWAAPIVRALEASPVCNIDPSCVETREYLQKITRMKDDGTVEKVANLGRVLQNTKVTQTLDETLRDLGASTKSAVGALRAAGIEDSADLAEQLAKAKEGANLLADSSRQLAEGVQLLVDQTRNMGGGLDEASAFLMAMRTEAKDPPMAGFYVPPQILTQEEFKKAAKLFISPDGHTARYLVQTALNPFGTEAMDQVKDIVKTAESAKPNTTLADAKITMVGFSAVQNDIRNYYNADVQFIILVTLLVVFLILVVLLKSLVAPIYLVGSVILSYVSALGIGVVFFQFLLGQGIHWSVPGMTFLVLVAVGADYNLLLIARIRDEAARGIRTGVIRTVAATGSVITSAGLIFAASMFGLTFSSLQAVIQIGFVIGVGLLLDTFVVRTITVPALAVLVGDFNWWPSKPVFTAKPLITEPLRGKRSDDDLTEPIVNGEPAQQDSDYDPDAERTEELVSVGAPEPPPEPSPATVWVRPE